MKVLVLALTLCSLSAFAGFSGAANVYYEASTSVVEITDDAAKAIYDNLNLNTTESTTNEGEITEKHGANVKCKKTISKSGSMEYTFYECILKVFKDGSSSTIH